MSSNVLISLVKGSAGTLAPQRVPVFNYYQSFRYPIAIYFSSSICHLLFLSFFFVSNIYLFFYLAALDLPCHVRDLPLGMWDLLP